MVDTLNSRVLLDVSFSSMYISLFFVISYVNILVKKRWIKSYPQVNHSRPPISDLKTTGLTKLSTQYCLSTEK